jgi:hypothetical protein
LGRHGELEFCTDPVKQPAPEAATRLSEAAK